MEPLAVATVALQGASAALAFELAIRSAYLKKREKNIAVKIGKFLLGVFMTIKACLFLSFHGSLWQKCNAVGKLGDLFYHLAVTAGNLVLLTRVQSIMPAAYKTKSLVLHCALLFIRFVFGIVDVVLVRMSNYTNGSCMYTVEDYWGPVYTFFDTLIDLYVSAMISIILISHIRSLKRLDSLRGNTMLYTSVIYNNAVRTVCLSIVNFLSAIFVIAEFRLIMLLWPIINILFVVLIGYDSDVTNTIRTLRQKKWQAATATATTLNDELPTISEPNPAMRRASAKRDYFFQTPRLRPDNISLMSMEDWKPTAAVVIAEPLRTPQSTDSPSHETLERRIESDIP